MIIEFLKEERGQGAIEYILLAGGIIIAAVVIFSIYGRMTQSTAEALNRSVGQASATMENRISNEITNGLTG